MTDSCVPVTQCMARVWNQGYGGQCTHKVDPNHFSGNEDYFCPRHSQLYDDFLCGRRKAGFHGIYGTDDWGEKLNGGSHPWKAIEKRKERVS